MDSSLFRSPSRPVLNRREALQRLAGVTGAVALGGGAFAASSSAASAASAASASSPLRGSCGENLEPGQDTVAVGKINDNLYVLSGVGGNIAVLAGKFSTLQVDSGNAGTTPAVLKAIQGFTEVPVSILINTHWHADHTGGNPDMAKQGSRIIAHTNTRKRLSTDQFVEALNSKVPALPSYALPVLTFDDKITIYPEGEELHLVYAPSAHTDTDIAIYFGKSNVLHTGDLFFNGMYPFIDSSSGGWIGGMVKAADRILAVVDDKTKIIPGHGPVGTRQQFKVYREMLVTVQKRITPLVKSGKTADQVVAAKPLADLDDKWGKGFMKPDVFVKVVYGGIKKFGA